MNEMTLWQTLAAGGSVMIVIGLLSVAGLAIIIYDFRTLKASVLAPGGFFDQARNQIVRRELAEAGELCRAQSQTNIMAKVVLTGLDKLQRYANPVEIREAMENKARMEITGLWQNINYLSDIVAVAPLLGLLGTVFGMIQAFHAVPLQSAGLKTAMLAAGISKAMIATAAGLIVAIPVLMAYSYFRGQVLEVSNVIETQTTDLIRTIESL